MDKKSTETSPSNELNGRTAIVTGAGSGLGRSIAIGLANAAANVVIALSPAVPATGLSPILGT